MFWISTGIVGLMMFAMALGQYSVWYALLKLALLVAMLTIALMGVALIAISLKRRQAVQSPHGAA